MNRNTEHATYRSLAEAYRAAGNGILYIYVATSLEEGWLSTADFSPSQWYEKLVVVEREHSKGFLQEVGANDLFALIAVGHGFPVFVARNPTELRSKMELTRPWMEAINHSYVANGTLDPKTFKFPEPAGRNSIASDQSVMGLEGGGSWRIEGNKVKTTSGRVVEFKFKIAAATEVERTLVVVLGVPAGDLMTENVFGVSTDGTMLWQIEAVEANSVNAVDHYIKAKPHDRSIVRLYNSNGTIVSIDAHTGKVIAWGMSDRENKEEVSFAETEKIYEEMARRRARDHTRRR